MLKFNPGQRLTSFDALKHGYFEGHISSVHYDNETVRTEKAVVFLAQEMHDIKTQ